MNEDEQRISLTDEEGNEAEYYIIGDLEVDGKIYMAFEPCENENEEFFIFRVETDDEGEEIYATIDDDDEFDKVAARFEEEYMSELDLDGDEDGEDGED